MDKVNTFIVGAPKCGTTSLANYLKTHPNTCLSNPKEPHFFSFDLQNKAINTLQRYEACFEKKQAKTLIDGSTWYLFSKNAAQNIYNYNPDAKIIIMLRNPANMVFSLYLQNVFNGTEDENFEDALALEDKRKENKISPSRKEYYQRFLYREVGEYINQIDRYFKLFPSNNIKIIIFEDFVANTPLEYKKVLEFLDLEQSLPPEGFVVHNKYTSNKNQFFKRKLASPPKFISTLASFIPQSLKYNLGQKLMKLNRIESQKPKFDIEQKNKLVKHFVPFNNALEEKYKLNLSSWSN